jgi:hypothetical protein
LKEPHDNGHDVEETTMQEERCQQSPPFAVGGAWSDARAPLNQPVVVETGAHGHEEIDCRACGKESRRDERPFRSFAQRAVEIVASIWCGRRVSPYPGDSCSREVEDRVDELDSFLWSELAEKEAQHNRDEYQHHKHAIAFLKICAID